MSQKVIHIEHHLFLKILSGIIVTVFTLVVFAFTTFQTSADAGKSDKATEKRLDRMEMKQDKMSDKIDKLYELEKSR